MSNVALLILFNHNYESNFEKLEELYAVRFKNIFFIMPFYKGIRKNVITVYENSYYFQGYVSKALEQIKDDKFEHYIIIGDDLLLNPRIDEKNYKEYFRLNRESAFISRLFSLGNVDEMGAFDRINPFWPWIFYAFDFNLKQPGLEVERFLPSYETASLSLKRHGIIFSPSLPANTFVNKKSLSFLLRNKGLNNSFKLIAKSLKYINRTIPYPLAGGYADIVIVPHSDVSSFINYCGIFASLKLFVELALPTALCFSVSKIVVEKDTNYTSDIFWQNDIIKFENKYRRSLKNLFDNFPGDKLFIHPVKFSKWS